MTATQSGKLPHAFICGHLSYRAMEESLKLLALDPAKTELERERIQIARIREANRAVSGEVKRVATIAECKRLGLEAEAEQLR